VLSGEGGHTRPSSPLDRVYKPSGLLHTASVHLNFLPRHHIAGAQLQAQTHPTMKVLVVSECAVLLGGACLRPRADHKADHMNQIHTFKQTFISTKSKIYGRRNSSRGLFPILFYYFEKSLLRWNKCIGHRMLVSIFS
jgi:hypothetical protein